jgi:hypothetical protein
MNSREALDTLRRSEPDLPHAAGGDVRLGREGRQSYVNRDRLKP